MANRAALPAGVITFLFTDIEGSTRLLRTLGPDYDDLLAQHHAVLREVWHEYDGHEVKTLGDSFMVVFERAADAVAAAVAGERELATVAWPNELSVRVRMGMHTGYARPADGDYTALVIHQAARVVGAARGGQVLLTQATAAEIERTGLPDDVVVHALGRFRVRDFDGPVALLAATGPGVQAVNAPLRVRPADGHNLMRPATRLIGRDADLARVRELVQPGRVVTLVGPGGVGKTRLMTEVALDLAPDWDDGAWFVDLAPVGDPALVAAAIGDALGAHSAPGAELWPDVLDHVASRRLLVLLDNCEQLSEACARAAAELVATAPRVAVIATSRGPLGLRGEVVHRLTPLAIEGSGATAVDLFLERSAGTGSDRAVVAELCAELDGLPLAIELAAARTTAVPPAEILRQVRRAPTQLRSSDPTLPERHRSIGRLLDWSWDLLPAAAQTLLGRLSVFAGGFSLDAAEVVGAGRDLPSQEVPELLWTLIDASLVRPEEVSGATRYRLLATVRAHVADRADPPDLAEARRRLEHLLIDEIGPARATGLPWIFAMELELDTVRAAATETGDDAVAQALACSIGRFHDARDSFRLGLEEVSRFVAARPKPGPHRVALLTVLADLHLRVGDLEGAHTAVEEAARLAHSAGCPEWDDAGIARARGDLAMRRGDPATTVEEVRACLAAGPSMRARARLLSLLGSAYATQGDTEASAEAFLEEIEADAAAGMDTYLPTTHGNLAESYLTLGRRADAARHQAISLSLAREQGQPVMVAFGMMVAARLVAVPRDAVVLQTKADGLLEDAGFVLYDEDERVRSALLADAAERLGAAAHADAVAAAEAMRLDEAVDLAARVLTQVGSQPETEQGA